ncbi:MAG TPA: hypothetical protein VGE07_11130 [Herpetosiphonaceae bacterium]
MACNELERALNRLRAAGFIMISQRAGDWLVRHPEGSKAWDLRDNEIIGFAALVEVQDRAAPALPLPMTTDRRN